MAPGGLAFPKSTFVSDRLPLYYNVVAEGHQICIAHLLRNLHYLDQLDPMQDWSKRMQELLRDAIRQRKHIDWVDIDREDIVKRFEKSANAFAHSKVQKLLTCYIHL